MWPAALTRLLRRRIIYIILVLLLLVCIIWGNLLDRGAFSGLHYDDFEVQRTRPLLWTQQVLAPEQHINRTRDPELRCRNSVQGRQLLTDERGFVCLREQMLPSGCCNLDMLGIGYYSCRSCNATTNCCRLYEYCVSCCLHPDKQPLLEQVLQSAHTPKYIYASVADHFELCLVKCRTNSHSVEHENKYRDALAKHCYGLTEAHESQRDVAPQAPVHS